MGRPGGGVKIGSTNPARKIGIAGCSFGWRRTVGPGSDAAFGSFIRCPSAGPSDLLDAITPLSGRQGPAGVEKVARQGPWRRRRQKPGVRRPTVPCALAGGPAGATGRGHCGFAAVIRVERIEKIKLRPAGSAHDRRGPLRLCDLGTRRLAAPLRGGLLARIAVAVQSPRMVGIR